MKSYKINVVMNGEETSVYADSAFGSEYATNAAIAILGLTAADWISTEEYANG